MVGLWPERFFDLEIIPPEIPGNGARKLSLRREYVYDEPHKDDLNYEGYWMSRPLNELLEKAQKASPGLLAVGHVPQKKPIFLKRKLVQTGRKMAAKPGKKPDCPARTVQCDTSSGKSSASIAIYGVVRYRSPLRRRNGTKKYRIEQDSCFFLPMAREFL